MFKGGNSLLHNINNNDNGMTHTLHMVGILPKVVVLGVRIVPNAIGVGDFILQWFERPHD